MKVRELIFSNFFLHFIWLIRFNHISLYSTKTKNIMIEITKTEAETKPFPKLMKSKRTRCVVFFTEPRKGLWITGGVWRESLNMENFEDYNEEVTLKNK